MAFSDDRNDPKRHSPPAELVLSNQLPDSAFLRTGGLLDQPLIWFNVNYAATVRRVLKDMSEHGFSAVKNLNDDKWSAFDMGLYEQIKKVREELAADG